MITVIIPTYNRPDFIERILNFIEFFDGMPRIIVADSSTPENAGKVKQLVEKSSLKIPVELISFDSSTFLTVKILSVAKQVNTKYLTLWADDDFLNPQMFEEAMEFLEANPSYSAAIGHGFVFPFEATRGEIGNVHNYPQRSNESDSPADRFWLHYTEHSSTFYSVRRSEEFVKIWEEMDKVDYDHKGSEFGELLYEALTVVTGKVKKLDLLHCVRQFRPSVSVPGSEARRDMVDWIGKVDHGNKYPIFKDIISKEIVASYSALGTKIDLHEAGLIVKKAYGFYVARELLKVSLGKDPFPVPAEFDPNPTSVQYFMSEDYPFKDVFRLIYQAMLP